MLRTLKQILYGLLFLGILVVTAWIIVIPRYAAEVATCIDGVQNQDEADVDCGGPCIDCELKNLSLQTGGVKIIEVLEKSSLLVKVKNPSNNYGAFGVPYKIEVTGLLGQSIGVIEGELNIEDGEEKYIAVVGFEASKNDISGADFSLGEFDFAPKADLIDYDFEIEDVAVTFPEKMVQAKGILINDSGFDIPEIVLTALFYTSEGDITNVGTSFISNIKAFEKRDFLISVPSNDLFLDIDQTEISWRVI